jgi:GT2 family glycosyltransferase
MTVRRPNPTISIIVATYARPEALARAIESLRQQTRRLDELIVAAWAEDGPALETVHGLQASPTWSLSQVSLRLVVTADNTVVAKENAGLAIATGDIVGFMDDDAVASPDWLERIASWYVDPSVGAVGGRDVIRRGAAVPPHAVRDVGRVRWWGRLVGNHHRPAIGARDVDFLKGVNMSFRRSLLPRIDERLAGPVPYGFEIDLGLHIRGLGQRVIFDPAIVVDHYPTTDYSASSPIAWTVNRNQTYVLLKRLSLTRKIAFLLYTMLIGDRNSVGVARVPLLILREGWTWAAVGAHFSGKVAGLRAYLGSPRDAAARVESS